jgi:TRAP-type C4-dicarboxylate transport system substrate-binding protein
VDGAENAPDAIWYAKHHEVSKYFSVTNHFRTPVVVVMNKAKFDALSPEYKEIITSTAHDTEEWSGTLYSQVSAALLSSLKKGGMTVADADEAAFRKAVEPVYAKHAEKFAAQLKAIREIK